ncbi:YkyB family protein [Desulforamulus aeronauticus]|uniref:YkyB-like protein n=1 Tax=Desulforamulus aeronauticus DSM 10349 TaxID=1121421 RepID=A0A1M6SPZ0_9FIRM|nr:YkyB family protein [Desulforamulus aeronauticus]SHK46709.1 YkyB-like protein [Desulforamulus aeronauticus DSM 10349]
MLQYKRWSEVPGYLMKKSQLARLGLQPKQADAPDGIIHFYSGSYYKREHLYDVERCIPIENYQISIDHLEMNTENLSEALYIINKFAKRKRDTKKDHYEQGHHDLVKSLKQREHQLYELKSQVLTKMLAEERAEILGIHKQIINTQGKRESINHLLLIQVGEHTFHRPAKAKDIKKHPFLGEIDIISAEKESTSLTFLEAVKLLEKYLAMS